MHQICLIFFIFLPAVMQTEIIADLQQPLVSASEATLLTTAPLVEESLKKYKLSDEFNEIASAETMDVSNISKMENNENNDKITKNRFKIAKVFTNCSREIFEMRVELNRPFHGILYAKEFPHECRARGTLETDITLRLPTSGCGVRVEPRHDGSMELSVRIMMQMEEKLRQSSDILRTVKCRLPMTAMGMFFAGMEAKNKNGLRHGRMQNANRLHSHKTPKTKQQLNASADMETTHLPPSSLLQSSTPQQFANAHSSQTPRVRIWLELGGPDGSGSVVVGQATTLTVRAVVPGTMGVRIVDCAALDGLGESTQQLLDERGCPIDEQVMPALHTHSKPLEEGWSKHNDDDLIEKTYTTTFPAFKFPDRERLHVSCGVQLCKGPCPNINCRNNEKLVINADKHLARIEVFNSLAVTAPQIEIDRLRFDRRHNMTEEYQTYIRPLVNDGTLCLSVSKLAISFCILGTIFLCAVIVAVTSLIRSRRKSTLHNCGTISSNSGRLHRTDMCNSMFSSSSDSAQSVPPRFGSKFFMPYYPNSLPYGRVY